MDNNFLVEQTPHYDIEIVDTDTQLTETNTQQMSKEEAQELTETIKAAGVAIYVLIAKAHDGKAYKALGYETFEKYVKTEFDLSRNRAYQLLNLSKTIQAIEEVAPSGSEIKLTEAQARDIKRELPKITERIKEETTGKNADETKEIIEEIIKDERKKIQKEKEEQALNEQWGDEKNFSPHTDNTPQKNFSPPETTNENNHTNNTSNEKTDDENTLNIYLNNVDSALYQQYESEKEEKENWVEKPEHTRPALAKVEDIAFFLDFIEKIENFPSVHRLLSSLTTSQRKILSRKAMIAADYLNELMDELSLAEMSQ